jgi:hypothetical protein
MFRGDGSVELFTEFINPIVVTNKLDLRIILNMDAGSVLEFIEGGLFAFAPFAPPFCRLSLCFAKSFLNAPDDLSSTE